MLTPFLDIDRHIHKFRSEFFLGPLERDLNHRQKSDNKKLNLFFLVRNFGVSGILRWPWELYLLNLSNGLIDRFTI